MGGTHVQGTLYGSGYDEEAPKGVIESFGMPLLDSGCTRTVTGKSWLNAYIESLPDDDKQSVKYSEDKSKFRFGDGKEVMSEATVQIPAYLARQRVMINTSLVEKCTYKQKRTLDKLKRGTLHAIF